MAEQTGTNIGTKLAISTALPSGTTVSDYESLTWSNIGQIISIGERGQQVDDLTVEYLVDGIRRHRKGTIDYGVFDVVIEPSFADAGQDALRAHIESVANSGNDVAIRETDPAENVRYYQALLANYRYSEATPGTNKTVTFQIRANTAFITDEA